MLPVRLQTLSETFEGLVTAIEQLDLKFPRLSNQLNLELSASFVEETFTLNLSQYGQVNVKIREIGEHVIPINIGWDGQTPVVTSPVQTIVDAMESSINNMFWLTDWYVRNFPEAEVHKRLADHLQNDISRFIRQVAVKTTNSPGATSLIRIDMIPERFVKTKGMTAPQAQLAQKIESGRRVKARWPEQIDISAGSQDKPMLVASVATGGMAPVISGTPFNYNYTPGKRGFMIRSFSGQPALLPSRRRVTVKDMPIPFANSTVLLMTAFLDTEFNSLDAQAIRPGVGARLSSVINKTIQTTNPVSVLAQRGNRIIGNQPVGFDHMGNEITANIPRNALCPTGGVGGVVTDVIFADGMVDGTVTDEVSITYQYFHPVESGDKLATPGGLKGCAVEVDFEAEALIDGLWRSVDVLSSAENIYKRGAASVLHGALELYCELNETTMEVGVQDLWEDVRPEESDLLTGNVPVRLRRHIGGAWTEWEDCGTTWVGLVPWMRTANTNHSAMKIGSHAVPSQAVTQVSCLRGSKLIKEYLPRETPLSTQLLDLISVPCGNLDGMTKVEDGAVTYRGRIYHPTIVDRPLTCVGTLSMRIVKEDSYAGTLLDENNSEGLLLNTSKVRWSCLGWRNPGFQAKWLFIPPELAKELVKSVTVDPVTGGPIVNRLTLYLNSFMELQQPGADPNGTRQSPIKTTINQILLEEVTGRDGIVYREWNAPQPGIQYVNLALDICPEGQIWLSKRVIEEYQQKVGPLSYGQPGLTRRFPTTTGKGLVAVELREMPDWIHADVITHSHSSEQDQDGDNDGDLSAVRFFGTKYKETIHRMRRSYQSSSSGRKVEINVFPKSHESQLDEAIAMAELKAKIGPASAVIYQIIIGMRSRETWDDVMELCAALLKSAVKKHIKDTVTWDMTRLQYTQEDSLDAESIKLALCEIADNPEATARGFDAYLQWRKSVPNNAQLAYNLTLGAPRLNKTVGTRMTDYLRQVGTDRLLSQLREELEYGAY